MKQIKYLVNGIDKGIVIFDTYKTLLEQHQVDHTLIKMYDQVFLNFDEYTFLHSIHDCHSNISKRLYFINEGASKDNVFLEMQNHYIKQNYNYTYTYKRCYINNESVSIEQRINRIP